MGTIRVIVADDHPVVRSGLRLLLDLEDDIEVVAEAGDIDATLRAVLGHKPDVLVLDLSMPGTLTSLEALPLVRERCPRTATVVLTMQKDPEYARRSLRAGALGYVLKDGADAELVEAVRRAGGRRAPTSTRRSGRSSPRHPSSRSARRTASPDASSRCSA